MKLTKIRSNIIKLFKNNHHPLTSGEVIIFLKKNKINFNRSTVFRNLSFLLKENFLIKVNLGDGKIHYELKNRNHHHHIVCEKCKKIIDFYDKKLDELIFKLGNKLSKKNKIKIISHQIEFFGFCEKCQD